MCVRSGRGKLFVTKRDFSALSEDRLRPKPNSHETYVRVTRVVMAKFSQYLPEMLVRVRRFYSFILSGT